MVRNVTLETLEDTALDVDLPATDDGALMFTIVAAPEHGTLSDVSTTGAITYTPSADYDGEDSFVFRATDSSGQSAEGTVIITVTPVNNEPTISSVANQKITADGSTGELAFTVGDVVRSANLVDGTDIQNLNAGSARNLGLASMPAR